MVLDTGGILAAVIFLRIFNDFGIVQSRFCALNDAETVEVTNSTLTSPYGASGLVRVNQGEILNWDISAEVSEHGTPIRLHHFMYNGRMKTQIAHRAMGLGNSISQYERKFAKGKQ